MKRYLNIVLIGFAATVLVSCGGGEPELLPKIAVVSDVSVTEGDTETKQAVFTIKITGELSKDGDPSVKYLVRHLTTTDEDFSEMSGTLEFSATGEEQTITIDIAPDEVYEVNKEFEIRLSEPVNARLTSSDRSRKGVIRDNDPCVAGECEGYITADTYPGMTLDWSDEFDGTDIDMSIWDYDMGAGGWWNAQLQEFTNATGNSFVENGELVLRATESGNNIFSAQLKTQGKKMVNRGRLDIRAKFPHGKGIWPRIWLKPENNVHGGWPQSGEIILGEIYGHSPNVVHTLVDYGKDGNDMERHPFSYAASNHNSMADVYHTYSLLWEDGRLTCFVDGEQYMTLTRSEVQAQGYTYPYTADFHLIFSMAVGGTKVGNPEAGSLPAEMRIDYVRYYKM